MAAPLRKVAFRFIATSADPSSVRRLVMPLLSPTFREGTLVKWHLAPGDEVTMYDACFDVTTASLTEDQLSEKKEDNGITLSVETMDNGFVSNLLVDEGAVCTPGTTLAFIVEEESDISSVNSNPQLFASCEECTWQAYLR